MDYTYSKRKHGFWQDQEIVNTFNNFDRFKWIARQKILMKLNALLKGRDYFYIMHLNYANQGERTMEIRERLWNYARENEVIGLNHNFVEGLG